MQPELDNTLNRHRVLCPNPSQEKSKAALFLDRDGVIIEDKNYISNPNLVSLCKGAKNLLLHANHFGWPVIIITNQSGISRGYFNWLDYERVTDRLLDLIGCPCPIKAIYANGESKDNGPRSWRKPNPTMIFKASKEFNIDLQRSILIGDRLTDLQAGARAGIDLVVHVLTGHGKNERQSIKVQESQSKKYFLGEKHKPKILMLESLESFPLELFKSQLNLTSE